MEQVSELLDIKKIRLHIHSPSSPAHHGLKLLGSRPEFFLKN